MEKFSTYTDSELFLLFKKGEAQAYAVLFNRYWEGLYEKASYILDNQAVAEDIVQDVFFSLWARREELDIVSVKGWLEQAVRFRVFSAIREEKTGRLFQQRLAAVSVDICCDDPLLFKEHQALMDWLIEQLPEDYRASFRLSRQHELSYKQIADSLHLSERTVRYHIAKSLEYLREHYTYLVPLLLLWA